MRKASRSDLLWANYLSAAGSYLCLVVSEQTWLRVWRGEEVGGNRVMLGFLCMS